MASYPVGRERYRPVWNTAAPARRQGEGSITTTSAAWRRIPLKTGAAADLLREGVAVFESLQSDPRPVLRWYRATDPVLVLGRGQRAEWFTHGALPVVGRFSGGGAVLMDDGLLSLDVVMPASHPLLGRDIGAVFDPIGQAWAAALSAVGVPDVAVHRGAPTTPRRDAGERERIIAAICYATLGRGEVTTGGRKIVGLAQRRRRPGTLVQCGLLRRWRPEPLLRALGATDNQEVVLAAAGLDDLLVDPPDDAAVMQAVEDALDGVVAGL